jgi:hypothetical protein
MTTKTTLQVLRLGGESPDVLLRGLAHYINDGWKIESAEWTDGFPSAVLISRPATALTVPPNAPPAPAEPR